MTEEEFLKRWIMHYIHPEYFYIPFGDYMKLIEKIAYKNGVYLPKDEIDPETGKKYSPPAQGYSKFTVALPLDSKEVQITTSGIEESQAGIFIYDPHDEEPELEGYSLFTLDLSAVQSDLKSLREQLEACHDCWEEVVVALQRYDPDYNPAEGECPSDKVDEVVAAIQQYIPDYEPVPDECPAPKIPEVYQKGRDDEEDENPPGYKFPKDDPNNPDPNRYDKIADAVGGDPLTDNDLHIIVKPMDDRYPITPEGRHNVYYGFYDSITGAFIDRSSAYQGGLDLEHRNIYV